MVKLQSIARRVVQMLPLLMTCQMLLAQSISGSVNDAKTGEPLAYVHIGISGRAFGTISDEQGRFSLQLNRAYHADTLTFSMIGYRRLQLPVAHLLKGSATIELEPSVTRLREVVVRPEKVREQMKFGRTKPTKTTTGASGIGDYGVGQEIGTEIKNDGGKYVIDAISFHHRWNTVDSILYRINIYNLKDGRPDTSILHSELFVTARKRDKWVTKQVKEEIIVFDRDIFVSIELVRRWNNGGDNLLFYSHGEGYSESQSYIRPASQAEWTTDFAFPLALYLTVEKLE